MNDVKKSEMSIVYFLKIVFKYRIMVLIGTLIFLIAGSGYYVLKNVNKKKIQVEYGPVQLPLSGSIDYTKVIKKQMSDTADYLKCAPEFAFNESLGIKNQGTFVYSYSCNEKNEILQKQICDYYLFDLYLLLINKMINDSLHNGMYEKQELFDSLEEIKKMKNTLLTDKNQTDKKTYFMLNQNNNSIQDIQSLSRILPFLSSADQKSVLKRLESYLGIQYAQVNDSMEKTRTLYTNFVQFRKSNLEEIKKMINIQSNTIFEFPQHISKLKNIIPGEFIVYHEYIITLESILQTSTEASSEKFSLKKMTLIAIVFAVLSFIFFIFLSLVIDYSKNIYLKCRSGKDNA